MRTDTLRKLQNGSVTLWRTSAGLRHLIIISAFFGVIMAVLPYIQITATQRLVDVLAAGSANGLSARYWMVPLGLLLLTFAAMQMMGSLEPWLDVSMRERQKGEMSTAAWQKVSRMPLSAFEDSQKLDMMYRALAAADGVYLIWSSLLKNLLGNTGGNLLILIMLWNASPIVATILLLSTLPIGWTTLHLTRRLGEAAYGYTRLERKRLYWMGLGLDAYAGAELRLYRLGKHVNMRWAALSAERLREQARCERHVILRLILPTMFFLSIPSVAALTLLTISAVQHTISIGTLVALAVAIGQYRTSVSALVWQCVSFGEQITNLYSYSELLNHEEEEEQNGPLEVAFRKELRFDNVFFRYPGSDTYALQDINLVIRPGERIALIGENGSGKTTLIKLLTGLYQPTEGRLTVDGHDISKLPANAWRNKVAVVFQDFMRYALTLRENITLSDKEDIPEQTLLRNVLHRTGLDELANTLPDGLDTLLGREFGQGHDLSMGQWQRIALARALCRSTADILILDEPTSWQDAFEEFEVYRYFQQWAYPDKTIILISHRMAPAALADRIIVLHQGSIVEQGSHRELLARNGIYAQLYAEHERRCRAG